MSAKEKRMVVSPAMRPLLLLCVKFGTPLLLVGVAYLVVATATTVLATATPDAFGPAGRSLVDSMNEHGSMLAGVLAMLGLEVWACSWLLRAIPPEKTD